MKEAFDALARLGVATVHEAAGKTGLVDLPLVQVVAGTRVAGRARTVRCAQDDNLMVHAVMPQTVAGDVLVLTMPEPTAVALVGELLATQAASRGAAAILVDAAVRDRDELEELGLPIWTRYVRAQGARRLEPGELDVPVVVGGARVRPDDVVVLDSDGAVVVPAERVDEVLEAAVEREAREAELRVRFAAGELSYDVYELQAVIEGASR